MYKVTFAIPIYNVEQYVERALNSALTQTFESIEYILVDDKGTDRSREIVDRIIKKHPRKKDIRIIDHATNIGTGAVRNTAIDNAQGEFLYFMDSDDEVTPNCISILYNAMIETPVDFVTASHKCKTQNKHLARLYPETIYSNTLIGGSEHAVAEAFYLERIPISVYTWNKLYNVNFLRGNNVECIPHHLSEDIWFTHQIILKAQSCRLLSDVTYIYYETPDSTAGRYNSNKSLPLKAAKTFEEIVTLQTQYAQNYKKTFFYPKLTQSNYGAAVGYAILIYKSKAISSKEKALIIRNLVKYPITWREWKTLIKTQYKNGVALKISHYINYFISKAPTICLKIALQRVFVLLKKTIKRI
jgi:glycosyltransferase involved in cell wall biosynthesis